MASSAYRRTFEEGRDGSPVQVRSQVPARSYMTVITDHPRPANVSDTWRVRTSDACLRI